MRGLTEIIQKRLADLPQGTQISAAEFLHLANRPAIDQLLSRLARKGILARAARGRYVVTTSEAFSDLSQPAAGSRFRYALPRQLDVLGRPTGRGIMLGSMSIDRKSSVPLQNQLYQKLYELLRTGLLKPGKQLPSSRVLARELGVSRNTVLNVYARLLSEGYLKAEQGVGTVVVDRNPASYQSGKVATPLPSKAAVQSYKVREPSVDVMLSRSGSRPFHGNLSSLRPFNPNVEQFPFKTWRQLIARRSVLTSDDLFGYGHLMGYIPLRKAIADYIVAYRGIQCDWRQVIITNGAQGAINLISQVLVDRGDAVWMEEPGYHWARFAFLSRGAEFVPLNVSPESGWQLQPPERHIQLVYVTPSCQQPLCKNMPLETRLHVIGTAAQHGAWIIEDDFDNEFSSPTPHIPAIQGLDNQGRTIYIGTFAKTMFPALRIGFMVVPDALLDVVERMIPATGNIPSLPTQAAVCDFLEQSHFSRHVRKMRMLYDEQRAAFFQLYSQYLADWLIPICDCVGLQVPFLLRHEQSDARLMALPAARSLGLMPLSNQYYLDRSENGFVLGYAAPSRRDLGKHIRSLAEMLAKTYPT